jgi:hypothetical protein
MKRLLRFSPALALAALCFATAEPIVSRESLITVETSINDRIRSNISDPYDLLGTARGTYLEGYGAVFTAELNLIVVAPLTFSPFKPRLTEQELTTLHERKVRKLETLEDTMRSLMVSASKSLPGLPPDERIVMEAFLFNFRWENSRGLPRRVILSGQKRKLMDAASRHASPAEFASIIQTEEL